MTGDETDTDNTETDEPEHHENAPEGRQDDGQDYVDRSKIDFDPDDGLLSGTAIDGTSEIPGPHKADDENTEETPSDDDNGGTDTDAPIDDE